MNLQEMNSKVRYPYSKSSLAKLQGVHPDMIRFAFALAEILDCKIVSGVRTTEEQAEKFAKGLTDRDGYYKKSSHQIRDDGYGHALDILPLPGKVNMYLDDGSEDNIRWGQFDGACHAVAHQLGIAVKTGFKWRSSLMASMERPERENTLPDGNHVELV
jgi:peptidoglycan L-alanyl-D-glutamate endopeptidase CwlK